MCGDACFLPSAYQFHDGEYSISPVDTILNVIKTGVYENHIRSLPDPSIDKKRYQSAKTKLPAWAFNGTFKGDIENDNFLESSGLFHIDIDNIVDMESTKERIIYCIPELYALWVSPSGKGLKGLIRIPDDFIHNDAEFKIMFSAIESYLAGFGIVIDAKCKDVRRLCFVCSDPDIYISRESPPFVCDLTIPETGIPVSPLPIVKTTIHHADRYIARCVNIIASAVEGNKHDARLRAGKLAGGYIAGGLVDENAMMAALFDASRLACSHPNDDAIMKKENKAVMDGIEKGKLSPLSGDDPNYYRNDAVYVSEMPEYLDEPVKPQEVNSHNDILDKGRTYCKTDLTSHVHNGHLLKELSKSIAKARWLPVDSVFLMGLAIFSSMACRKYSVAYEGGYDSLPIGLYAVAEQPPGLGKSMCMNIFQAPFFETRKESIKNRKEEILRLEQLADSDSDAKDKLMQLKKNPLPPLFVTNTTPEALERYLTTTDGYFSAVSSEQGLSNSLLGLSYGDGKRANNNDLLLQGFDGGYMSSMRVGRECFEGEVVGGVALFAQDGSVDGIIASSKTSGMSQRFLMLVEKDSLGTRDHLNKSVVCRELIQQYKQRCTPLAETICKGIKADQVVLTISKDCWHKINVFQNQLEPELKPTGKYSHPLLNAAVAKCNMQVMKIAANLHLMDETQKMYGDISDKHVLSAIGIVTELLDALATLCMDKGVIGSCAEFSAILNYLTKSHVAKSERDILNGLRNTSPFKDMHTNKSAAIRKTLADMEHQGILSPSFMPLSDGKMKKVYSLGQ